MTSNVQFKTYQVDRRFSQRLRDKKRRDAERDKRAARWVNLCLESLFEDADVRDGFLAKWMGALNEHLEMQAEASGIVSGSYTQSRSHSPDVKKAFTRIMTFAKVKEFSLSLCKHHLPSCLL